MVTAQKSGVITMRTMFPFEQLEKVYVPDEDSLEQRMNIFYGQLYSLYFFVYPFSSFFDKE